MTENLYIAIQALGGLGLFLLGMVIMTGGLREMAGDAIRSALMRFTSSPTTGAVTGAVSTAILQSSSATTVAAVGFVGAGLMTFTSSLGIIFGANIGTTITGWLVALLGFKLKLGAIMLPLIFVGVIMRMFTRGKTRSAGYAIAGFGLIIFAITVMQAAMQGLQAVITPYIALWNHLSPAGIQQHAEISLLAFHTLFNTLGVIIVLPFTGQFARLIKKLLPERITVYPSACDDAMLQTPVFALTAVQENLEIYFVALLHHMHSILDPASDDKWADLARMQIALDETEQYLDTIEFKASPDANGERMLALVHALDHLQRLHERCEQDEDRAVTARQAADLSSIHQGLLSMIIDIQEEIIVDNWKDIVVRSRLAEMDITEQVEPMRDIIASSVTYGRLDVPGATDCLQAVRWLDRVSHHIARISYHLQQARLISGK